MVNRLADAVSPYLRSHATNPVDWYQWGPEPFAEAARRQVPVLISIGYATCHWCHVMARESFSDPELADYLNANFVSIKVDREEHPDVDSTYLAAAGAFTDQLGWPLTAFATPTGRTFYAGTYFPPVDVGQQPSFRRVLEAVQDAWTTRRDEVDETAGRLATALAASLPASPSLVGGVPTEVDFASIVADLLAYEDREHGGFGGAPKFPVAPVLGFLLDRGDRGDAGAAVLARRTLEAIAASPLRDPVEGGFFRYAVRGDWSEPHYERMLYDNAQLLDAYARLGRADIADGIADFLLAVLQLPGGGFASAQDSESTVNGERVEGGYYALTAAERARQSPPALDDKVLTGWNGLAIGALASAGTRLGHPEWITAATTAAGVVSAAPAELVRARIGARVSSARPTLEDFGMLADGLISLALATGDARHAVSARELVLAAIDAAEAYNTESAAGAIPPTPLGFRVPGGVDPVLAANGLVLDADPSEGAYPSGLSAIARAAVRLHALDANPRLIAAATLAYEFLAPLATNRPMSFGSTLAGLSALGGVRRQLIVVTEDVASPLAELAIAAAGAGVVVSVVTPEQAQTFARAGFELYESRGLREGRATAYLCENFVCALPVTEPRDLAALLRA